MSVELAALIKRLNSVCHQALKQAAELCVSNTNYNVEVEHLLLKLLDIEDTDFALILDSYQISGRRLQEQCGEIIDGLKRGNSRTPAMSPHIVTLLQQAWMYSSMHFNQKLIRTGSIALAFLADRTLRGIAFESFPLLLNIPLKSLEENIKSIIQSSVENKKPGVARKKTTVPAVRASENDLDMDEEDEDETLNTDTPILDQYTIDITRRAQEDLLDPVEGRDREIRQIIDILLRRRQNNPILTGDAGVGKTAVVEGFAMRVVKGDVPPPLENISVRGLDLGLLQAGAGVKGEFEERLKNVISEVKSSAVPIILFIDEAHTLIGAGGQAGQSDAANLLKPALARGELRTIAATTWGEYKKYFEKDHALVRRFQVIKIEEPNQNIAVQMLRTVCPVLENHHKVRILDEAIIDAVNLSHRYISGRKLPDKAVSLLDTACARVAVGQNSAPGEVEDSQRRIKLLEQEVNILRREQLVRHSHEKRLIDLEEEIASERKKLEALETRWRQEMDLLDKIVELRDQLESGEEDNAGLREKLDDLEKKLEEVQQKQPMLHVNVDSNIVASIVSDWTGIPAGKMMTDEIQSILSLKDKMNQRLIGQDHALEAISQRIRTSRAKLEDPGKPIGVFMLVGPSGVGKTETALTLSEILYGGEDNVISINMSEYQEAHTVSSLKGAPPGYVGYGTGGILTEAVRRQPFSVVLLDEVEKAHPDVMELFYQVFDKGILEDGEGVKVNFKNTIILLTSNIGTDIISRHCLESPDSLPDPGFLTEQIRPELLGRFKPAFLGRLVVVPYYQLGDQQIKTIINLKLERVRKRFQEHNKAELYFDDIVRETIAARCTEVDSGARNIDNILTHSLLPGLSREILTKMAIEEEFRETRVGLKDDGQFSYHFKN